MNTTPNSYPNRALAERRLREGIYLDDPIYRDILKTAEEIGVRTSKYRGRPGKTEVTHQSYTLMHRYRQ